MSIDKRDENIKKLVDRRFLVGLSINSFGIVLLLLDYYLPQKFLFQISLIALLTGFAFSIWAILPLKKYSLIAIMLVYFIICLVITFLAFLWI